MGNVIFDAYHDPYKDLTLFAPSFTSHSEKRLSLSMAWWDGVVQVVGSHVIELRTIRVQFAHV
ncbi:MAG: hypothetical protein ACE5R6_08490 [Candidatus Heimdallarchaeota archaeon]